MSARAEAEAVAARWNLVLPVDLDVQDRTSQAQRPASLEGLKIGLLNNSKGNADHLLERVAARLGERYGVREFVRMTKPIFSRVAPDPQLEQLKACDAVVTAIAD